MQRKYCRSLICKHGCLYPTQSKPCAAGNRSATCLCQPLIIRGWQPRLQAVRIVTYVMCVQSKEAGG
jgi:hypothetical protein